MTCGMQRLEVSSGVTQAYDQEVGVELGHGVN